MSSQGGRLWKGVAYQSLAHNGSNFFPTRMWLLPRIDPSSKSQFQEKNQVLPIEKFPFLALARNTIYIVLSIFRFIICQVAAYGKLEMKENLKLLTLKVVAVAK